MSSSNLMSPVASYGSPYVARNVASDLTGPTVTNHYAHMRRASPGSVNNSMSTIHSGRGRREDKPDLGDDVVSRFELFILGDGEKKVTEEPDTRVPSTSIFTFNKEDHTLGNVIRSRLLQSPHVLFSAYKVPHPLESKFILRVQTDGSVTPRGAVIQACRDLVQDYALLNQEFTKEWELRKMVGDGNNGTANGNAAGDGANGATE